MSAVSLLAKVTAVSGRRDELVEALQGALAVADAETGTRYYILHLDDADADVLWFYELYESRADLEAHMSSDEFKARGAVIAPLVAKRSELTFLTPIGGKGL